MPVLVLRSRRPPNQNLGIQLFARRQVVRVRIQRRPARRLRGPDEEDAAEVHVSAAPVAGSVGTSRQGGDLLVLV